MPSPTDTVLGLVELIYAAASDPQHWPPFLTALKNELNTESANMTIAWFSEDASSRPTQRRVIYSAGFPQEGLASYQQHFGVLDPFLHEYKTRFPRGGTVAGEDLIDRNSYHRSAFYNEFAKFYNVEHICFSRLEQHASTASGLGLIRSEEMGPFDTPALQLVAALVPHLRRAIHISRMLCQGDVVCNHITDEMNIAAVGLDARGQVISVSEAAQEILDHRNGLVLNGGQLSASNSSQDSLLQETMATALSASRAESSPPGKQSDLKPSSKLRPTKNLPYCGCLPLSRSSSKHPLQVIVHPLSSSELLLENRPSAMVIVIDPDRKTVPPVAALQILYGLTPAESRLADLLLQGHELSQCAELLGNTIAGARVRLKSIMRKTNVSRQSELMRLFVGFPKTQALRHS